MSSKVEDLEPVTREMCRAFLAECEARMLPPIRVTHTLRSMDEQMHLYAKGRMKTSNGWLVVDSKAIVTKARPGESPHNFGAAFDICIAGADPYPDDDKLWESYGRVGESCGLSWGGPLGEGDRFRWDKPHFERRDWRVLKDRKA